MSEGPNVAAGEDRGRDAGLSAAAARGAAVVLDIVRIAFLVVVAAFFLFAYWQ